MQLQIEKLVYGGDGLARLPADDKGPGKTIFLPFVIPGEKVEATLTETRPGFARAHLNSVIDPSAERVEPGCPYFGRCGGCQYQHIDYAAQLRYKPEILRETLRRTAKLNYKARSRYMRLSRGTIAIALGCVSKPRRHFSSDITAPLRTKFSL